MGRLVRISIYALVILILYFWITAIVKTYQKNNATKDAEMSEDTISLDTLMSDSTALSLESEGDTLISNEDIVDGNIDYKSLDEKVKALEEKKIEIVPKTVATPPKEKPKPVSPSPKPAIKPKEEQINNAGYRKGDGGSYKVMAGSYLLKENAQKMVDKLKRIGYSNAEVVVFQSSGYHSVIACRHTSESYAKTASAELKSKGIDSFVKK